MNVGKSDLDGACMAQPMGTSVDQIKYGSCLQMDRLLTEQNRILCKLLRALSYFDSKQI
jgi:hypothetical protein